MTEALRQDVRLLEGGRPFHERLLTRVAAARRTILFRCFNWRDDGTGELVARALLAAADRGVAVTVLKDLVGATYEYYEGSQQSFLHKTIGLRTRFEAFGLTLAYGQTRWPRVQQSSLADAFLAHPNIRVEGAERRYDHSKVYIFDDDVMLVGGVGIGDDERLNNLDFMLELDGADHVNRYAERNAGRADFDPGRELDFLLHARELHRTRGECPLLDARLRLIAAASSRITIEMAYLGDPRITRALVEAVRRGVAVTLVTGVRANVTPDLNLASCDEILMESGAPPHLRVVLHPQPVHSKIIVIDGTILELGSTNFTLLSHGGYDEVDVYLKDAHVAREAEAIVERHASEGVRMTGRVPFRRVAAWIERRISERQARTNTP